MRTDHVVVTRWLSRVADYKPASYGCLERRHYPAGASVVTPRRQYLSGLLREAFPYPLAWGNP